MKMISVAAGLIAASLAYASPCPVMLVSGVGDKDGIIITFRNSGKLPIRQLELNCSLPGAPASAKFMSCDERNALFYPGMEYTLRYPYPRKVPQVIVSVKRATLSDGYVWKPSRRQPCRTLRIHSSRNR
jgi:hypothetical protein